MAGSALIPPPGIPPADGSFRRWSPGRGWVEALEARPFDAPGFHDVPLFTCLMHFDLRSGYAAHCGQTGVNLVDEARADRKAAERDGREALRTHGRDAYDAQVRKVLTEREASRG